MLYFNAADTCYKSITGAVAAGTCLRLRLCVPRGFGVTGARLVISFRGEYTETVSLDWDSTDGTEEWWRTDFVFGTPGTCFYHFEFTTGWGVTSVKRDGILQTGSPEGMNEWQQTVFDPAFKTPDSFRGGIIYQIFPDRFYYSGEEKKNVPAGRVFHGSFDELPVYLPDANGKILNNDYFCGDFRGIEQKLDYIASLGVDCIYLNPVSEAHSNHRYDTADYMKPDPLLGTAADFSSLCAAAHERGIKILIDGVYSHTGSDSIYFNREKRYGEGGAFNDEASPYRKWYNFRPDGTYDSWWGIETLPEVNENNPSFSEFITGEQGVAAYWLGLGADGIRLDVADELPDEFIEKIRMRVKNCGEEKLLLGEVWEDATNKISGGGLRRYFAGSQLDSVMNYPFRTAVTDFLLTSDAPRFMNSVYDIVLNYPPQAMNVCMNHLGTHDTERILSVLTGVSFESMTREAQAEIKYTPEQLCRAKTLLKQGAAINYCLPGIPSVYYGDEAGMTGLRDPFNRAFYPWGREDAALVDYFRTLGKIRRENDVLKEGGFYPLSAELGCVAFLRYAPGKKRIACIANNNPCGITYYLNSDMTDMSVLLGGEKIPGAVVIPAHTAVILGE